MKILLLLKSTVLNQKVLSQLLLIFTMTIGYLSVCLAQNVLEEVVVTAQKRAQNLQDLNIAITAFSSEDLRDLGMQSASDIATQSPNVTIKQLYNNAFPIVTIRGVGMNYFGSNSPSAAAVHVDEIYTGSPAILGFQLFDIDRVEILKGPQGTLYGRNTTAGTVNFVSRKPGSETEGYVNLSYGRFDQTRIEAAFGGMISDNLSGRIAGVYDYSDGWIKNRLTGDNEGGADKFALRGLLSWDVSEDLRVLFNLHGGVNNSETGQYKHVVNGTACPGVINPNPGNCTDLAGYSDPDLDPFSGEYNFTGNYDVDMIGGSVTINWDLPGFSVISITSYDELDQFYVDDADASPFRSIDQIYDESFDQFSQEIRLVSNNNSNLSWIAGIYYANEDNSFFRDADLADAFGGGSELLFYVHADQATESAAGFGHLEWQFTESLKLTLGGRYTWEKKEFDFLNNFSFGTAGDLVAVPPRETRNGPIPRTDLRGESESWNDFSGKVAIDWTPVDDLLLYFSFSKGFKSGGYPAGLTLTPDRVLAFDPEEVLSYEVGFKSSLVDGRVRFNGAIFYYDYSDKQENAFITAPGTGATIPIQVLTNAGQVEVLGVELDLQWLVTERLDLVAGLGYLDTEIKEFVDNRITSGTASSIVGNEIPNAPAFSFNGRAKYTLPVNGGGLVAVMTDFSFQDNTHFQLSNRSDLAESGYWVVNGRAQYSSPDGSWNAALWVKNLLDEEYLVDAQDFDAGYNLFNYGAPRSYGLSVGYAWN
jgi:iron complex outermembrane recepter protein